MNRIQFLNGQVEVTLLGVVVADIISPEKGEVVVGDRGFWRKKGDNNHVKMLFDEA